MLPNSSCFRPQPSGWHNERARLWREKPLLLALWHTRTPRRGVEVLRGQKYTQEESYQQGWIPHYLRSCKRCLGHRCNGQANQDQQPWARPPTCWSSATLGPTTPPPLALSSGVTVQLMPCCYIYAYSLIASDVYQAGKPRQSRIKKKKATQSR